MTTYQGANPNNSIDEFIHLWTTDIKDYFLIQMDNDAPDECVVGYIPTDGFLIIENDDIARLVIKNMVAAGVNIINFAQYIDNFHAH